MFSRVFVILVASKHVFLRVFVIPVASKHEFFRVFVIPVASKHVFFRVFVILVSPQEASKRLPDGILLKNSSRKPPGHRFGALFGPPAKHDF